MFKYWLESSWIKERFDKFHYIKENQNQEGNTIWYLGEMKDQKIKRCIKIMIFQDENIAFNRAKEILFHSLLKHEHIIELYDFNIEYFIGERFPIALYMVLEGEWEIDGLGNEFKNDRKGLSR